MNMCRERERRKFDPTKQYLIHKVLYMYTYTRECVCACVHIFKLRYSCNHYFTDLWG